MKYQGWTNAETWVTALYIDNVEEALLKAIETVKNDGDLVVFVRKHLPKIIETAPWAWKPDAEVNFLELQEHYLQKIKESA
jgi:hypothetical protein